MIPIPQYPMYSAEITMNHGTFVPYYLDESKDWGFDVRVALHKAI
jgi:alanine transaminase